MSVIREVYVKWNDYYYTAEKHRGNDPPLMHTESGQNPIIISITFWLQKLKETGRSGNTD